MPLRWCSISILNIYAHGLMHYYNMYCFFDVGRIHHMTWKNGDTALMVLWRPELNFWPQCNDGFVWRQYNFSKNSSDPACYCSAVSSHCYWCSVVVCQQPTEDWPWRTRWSMEVLLISDRSSVRGMLRLCGHSYGRYVYFTANYGIIEILWLSARTHICGLH